ncbi:MAG: cell wall-binding repeat-containing protein, partial [Acidimicrobiia bacterium]
MRVGEDVCHKHHTAVVLVFEVRQPRRSRTSGAVVHDITEATQENFCMRFKSRSRALAASALAASLGLAGLGLVAPAAQASEPTEATRIEGLPTYEGGTRYDTAAEAATTAYPDGAANVVLASGEKFPDALAGGGLAGQLDAPILLTLQGELPESTIEALAALDPTTVTILGESEAVSDAV